MAFTRIIYMSVNKKQKKRNHQYWVDSTCRNFIRSKSPTKAALNVLSCFKNIRICMAYVYVYWLVLKRDQRRLLRWTRSILILPLCARNSHSITNFTYINLVEWFRVHLRFSFNNNGPKLNDTMTMTMTMITLLLMMIFHSLQISPF